MEMIGAATFILIAGLVDDLRSQRVHNFLVVGLFAISVALSFFFRGWEGSLWGFFSLVGALALMTPLFMFGVFGGGDVKLFAVFAFCLEPMTMICTLLYSIFWGALFGLVRAALQKQLLSLVRVTYRIASRQRVERQEFHKIPYTFALIMGWLTQLTVLHAGGLL